MSDVWATIGMAKLIKQVQPRLFDYAFSHRSKQDVAAILNTRDKQPCLQVSGMIPASQQHISPVVPLTRHPQNNNSIIVLDLSVDSAYLSTLDSDEIALRLFTKTEERLDGSPPRPGLRTIQINKCPVLVPMASLRNEDAQRLGIDIESTRQRALQLTDWLDDTVLDNITKAMTREWPDDSDRDVDGTLYTGNFLSQSDKQRLATIRGNTPDSSSLS